MQYWRLMKHSLSLIKPGFSIFRNVESYRESWRWQHPCHATMFNCIRETIPRTLTEPSEEMLSEDLVHISME